MQNELANRVRQQVSEAQSNAISVRIELQADCIAGLWARHADARFGSIEPGDIEEAMIAARLIGDDTLQRSAGRVPQLHTFTHGTSEQRMRWFVTGYQSGDLKSCDTFGSDGLLVVSSGSGTSNTLRKLRARVAKW